MDDDLRQKLENDKEHFRIQHMREVDENDALLREVAKWQSEAERMKAENIALKALAGELNGALSKYGKCCCESPLQSRSSLKCGFCESKVRAREAGL